VVSKNKGTIMRVKKVFAVLLVGGAVLGFATAEAGVTPGPFFILLACYTVVSMVAAALAAEKDKEEKAALEVPELEEVELMKEGDPR
jgi:hypothetical protein